jgi:hypothetical protein
MPFYHPPKVLRAKERAATPDSFDVFTSYSRLNLSRSLRARHHYYMIGVCLLNFTPQRIFLFKLANLIH